MKNDRKRPHNLRPVFGKSSKNCLKIPAHPYIITRARYGNKVRLPSVFVATASWEDVATMSWRYE